MSDRPLLLETAVIDGSAAPRVDFDRLRALLDFCYRSRRKKPARLDLLIANDAEMARLNRRHLGKDNPTDVLAFDDGEMEDGRVRLGDIAIGVETAARVAAERGGNFEQELAFYALHGLLHLLGMRDDDDADRARMLAEQARAMRGFGWAVDDGITAITNEQ